MIIETIEGNLVDIFASGKIVAHGCNCYHEMASGVAGELASRFPGIREVDGNTNYGDISKSGLYTRYKDPENGGVCYNLYTQFHPGRDGSYGKIATAFENLNTLSKQFPSIFESGLYIPRIGAGIAGLEWSRVKAVINAVTPNVPIILVDFKPQKNDGLAGPKSPRKPFMGIDVLSVICSDD